MLAGTRRCLHLLRAAAGGARCVWCQVAGGRTADTAGRCCRRQCTSPFCWTEAAPRHVAHQRPWAAARPACDLHDSVYSPAFGTGLGVGVAKASTLGRWTRPQRKQGQPFNCRRDLNEHVVLYMAACTSETPGPTRQYSDKVIIDNAVLVQPVSENRKQPNLQPTKWYLPW